MSKSFWCFFTFILLGGGPVSARVFNIADTNVAAYFRGSGGMSMMGGTAYGGSSGTNTYFDRKDEPAYNYSGEIGLMIQLGESLSARIGVEGLQSRAVDAPGKSAGGAHLLNVDSRIVAFIPALTLEFKLGSGVESKSYLFLGGGYVTIKGTNDYTMTSAGTLAYGNGNYKEAIEGIGFMGQAGFGFEFLLMDNCTLATELGWRYLPISKLTHVDAVTTTQGAVAANATATDIAGAKRAYDMGGPFVGLSFRFYIPPLN